MKLVNIIFQPLLEFEKKNFDKKKIIIHSYVFLEKFFGRTQIIKN